VSVLECGHLLGWFRLADVCTVLAQVLNESTSFEILILHYIVLALHYIVSALHYIVSALHYIVSALHYIVTALILMCYIVPVN